MCQYDEQQQIPDRVLDNGMAQELRVASQQNDELDGSEQKMNKKNRISTQPISSKFLAACRQELKDRGIKVQGGNEELLYNYEVMKGLADNGQ